MAVTIQNSIQTGRRYMLTHWRNRHLLEGVRHGQDRQTKREGGMEKGKSGGAERYT